jgi:hypothetical protein
MAQPNAFRTPDDARGEKARRPLPALDGESALHDLSPGADTEREDLVFLSRKIVILGPFARSPIINALTRSPTHSIVGARAAHSIASAFRLSAFAALP